MTNDDENTVQRDQLLPGHEALVKLIEEFNIRFITRDENGEIFISYHDERLEPITITYKKHEV